MSGEAFILMQGTPRPVSENLEVSSPGSEAAETVLLSKAQEGDSSAFDALMRRYERRVLGLARRLLQHPDEATDIAQQAFLRFYRSLHRLSSARSPWPYICRIVVNLVRDTERRRSRHLHLPMEEIRTDEPASPEATPSQSALSQERGELLRQGLAQLPEKERQAIVLRDLEGFSTEEVARMLGTRPVTVRSQISRGRLRLRQLLERNEALP